MEENKIITIEQLKFLKQQYDFFEDLQEKYKAVHKIYKSKESKQHIIYFKAQKKQKKNEILTLIEKL